MTLRVRILAACGLTLFGGALQAADLLSVYERALQNDPLIREADANRLASRESKPQALAALLPQLNASGSYSDVDQGFSRTTLTPSVPSDPNSDLVPRDINTDSDFKSRQYDITLRQTLFRWDQWAALRRADAAGRAGGSRLPGRAAGPDPADLAALLRRARRAGHRRCRASDARSVLAPARAGGQALRGRSDRHHRRSGSARRARSSRCGRHSGEACTGHSERTAARVDRRTLQHACRSDRRPAARSAEPRRRGAVGDVSARPEPARHLRAARHRHREAGRAASRAPVTCRASISSRAATTRTSTATR